MSIRKRKGKDERKRIGILTFHCADNYGALLQAYALRAWLGAHRFEAEIVPYAPFYMTRWNWMIPLAPCAPGQSLFWGSWNQIRSGWRETRILPEFLRRKRRMDQFRREFLGLSGRNLRWERQLRHL